MNVNQKGLKGQLRVMETLHDLGYTIFTPVGDYSPVDLIAMSDDGSTFRLQVKYRAKMVGTRNPGKYRVNAFSMVNSKIVPIDRNMIDGWAIYFADDDRVVFLHKTKFTTNSKVFSGTEDFGPLSDWSKL